MKIEISLHEGKQIVEKANSVVSILETCLEQMDGNEIIEELIENALDEAEKLRDFMRGTFVLTNNEQDFGATE